MVVFDTSVVLLTLNPSAPGPLDPATGIPLTHADLRVKFLLKQLSDQKVQVGIPTPVLSEFLVMAGPKKQEFANAFISSGNFKLFTFDELAAIEVAFLEDADLKSGRALDANTTKAKVKFDRQIIAIAKVNRADVLYCSDDKLGSVAEKNKIKVIYTWDLPMPPEDKQVKLFPDEKP